MVNKKYRLLGALFVAFPLLLSACNESGSNASSSNGETSATSSSFIDSTTSGSETSSGGQPVEENFKFQTIKGNFDYLDDGATSKESSTCLVTNKFMKEGTFSLNIVNNGKQPAGILFLSDAGATSYYSLHLESVNGNKLVLNKVNGTSVTELGSCYITAGYNASSKVELKVIVIDKKIQCFYDNKLFISRSDEDLLAGNRIGLITKNSGTTFRNISLSKDIDFETVDTLITGHSYMELWTNYKNDLSRFDDIFNIGIGGTSANDWYGHVNEVVDYNPKNLIYMIGINDVGWNKSPSKYIDEVKQYINPLLEKLPEVKICLISVNNCPLYASSQSTIDEMNRLLWNYVFATDRLSYANVDKAFLKADGTPDASCFTDGLHPTAVSYKVIRDAIYDAFDGKNQPDKIHDDESLDNFDLESGKTLISNIKSNNTNCDWTFNENLITANSNGTILSSNSYSNFSIVLKFSNISQLSDGSDNPFFTKKAVKAFLFGGSEVDGKYVGYALHVSSDWFEILKLDGYNSTFIDGFNVDPFDTCVKLTLNGTSLSLSYGDGKSFPVSFNKKATVELDDYSSGKVGALKNDEYKSNLYVYEFKTDL